MKKNKIIRWLLKASAFVSLVFIMQACGGNPFSLETRKPSILKKTEVDTTVSEDLKLFGFHDKDGPFVEEYIE